MTKKVTMNARPQLQDAEKWIATGGQKAAARSEAETKRLTFDISADLHKRLKIACAGRGEQMTDFLRRIIEQELKSA